jgi:cysteine-rich repeat protein
MAKRSLRLGAPWVGSALLVAAVIATGACGSLGGDELFDSGAASGAGGSVTTSTSSTVSTTSTMATSSGQGGGSSSTASGPGGAGGSGGSASSTTSSSTTSSSTTSSSTTSSSTTSSSTTAASSSSSGGGVCGDGTKQANEACDKLDLGGQSCTNFNFSNPAGLACTAACALDPSGCMATCDGQKLEAGETCDGAFLNGHTCIDLGYTKGDGLKCVGCNLDGSGCKSTCGDGKLEPTEQCDDGNVVSGDGCDATCHIEATAGSTCGTAIPITIGLGGQDASGSTVNGGDHTTNSCTSDGPDRVYAVKVTANGFLTANLVRAQTSFDSVLYLGTGCSDANANQAILCNDSYDPQNQQALNGGEVVSIRVQANQIVYIFVDGFNAADSGTYQIHFDLSTGTDCADPVPIPLEDGTGMTVRGSNNGIPATAQGSCGGMPGGQVIYAVTRATDGPLDTDTVAANTNYNSVLYARSGCLNGFSELACSNNGGNAAESISIGNVNAGVATFVYVDGSQQGGGNASGNYGVTFTP